jgi:hypothetical protein
MIADRLSPDISLITEAVVRNLHGKANMLFPKYA